MPNVGVLHQARELVDQLDFPAAQQLLREALNSAPSHPAQADEAAADTAAFYAGVLLQLGEPNAARGWAAYAHAASQRLHGDHDRRSLHALGVLACSLHRAGALSRAAHHYHQLTEALTAIEGPDGDRTLAARADAAVVEHARGACSAARAQLSDVIAAHAALYGPGHPVGIRMLARLAAMWRDCGDFDRAHQLLDQARSAAAALDSDDDTHRLLVAAARAEADQTHLCGVESVPERSPAHAGVFAVPNAATTIRPADVAARQRTGTQAEWPQDEGFDRPANSLRPPGVPSQPARASTSHALALPAAPQPLFGTVPLYVPSAPPPAKRAPRPAPQRESRFPVAAAIAAGAVVAAAVALIAVAVLANRGEQPSATAGLASGSPSAPASASPSPSPVEPAPQPSGPVTDLTLTDDGDRLLITWIYPEDADAPIIISASKAGEPMKPLQSLPAGTESFVLPGLDASKDYCIAVTIAYRADQTVMSPPVCTNRVHASPTEK